MTDPVKTRLITLVPEIKKNTCGVDHHCAYIDHSFIQITLADVLRAIEKSNNP